MSEKLVGLRAVAKAYKISPSTAHKWLSTGALPARRNAKEQWVAAKIPRREITANLARIAGEAREQTSAERRAASRLYGAPSTIQRERELGIRRVVSGADLAALCVTVYRASGMRGAWDSRAVLDDVMRYVARAVAGDVVIDGAWRARVVFRRSLTETELEGAMATLSIPRRALRGGRVHFAVLTNEDEFLPMSNAYSDPKKAKAHARDELRKSLSTYRGTASPDDRRYKRAS